ncbi:steroid alpha reductase family protein [Niveomyces insectorum RCEF 264]|uniref:Steroid alpha reductase family protein n=1 Tax=Niveomyces insectorum RCEF 264 TaxID=1081102 RepID=A0A167NTH1_9HYPO|nr:steroid alpha reductase family protein [Niveomyces insectorum RCEF 264]
MAVPEITLAVANRSKAGTIKKLPPSISVPAAATVEEVKQRLAERAGVRDFNRIGVFDPQTRRLLSDRKAVIGQQANVVAAGSLLVQDLGPQVAWRTVFAVEYAGPILFHILFYLWRPSFPLPAAWTRRATTTMATASPDNPPTDVQTLVFVLFLVHFVKRELETLFLHRFAANTMPARNIVRNSAFYWLTAGLLCAWSLYAPLSPLRFSFFTSGGVLAPPRAGFGRAGINTSGSSSSIPMLLDYAALALFVVSELCNFRVHYHLAHLRAPGSTDKGIPNCVGSSLVTSPNYMFEVLAWVGVIALSRDLSVVLFISLGIVYMRSWSRGKERALRQLFPDKYKKKKYTMLPGLI